MNLKNMTPEESRAFIRKVMGPSKRQLFGKELEHVQFLMDMCEPVHTSNNQRTITDEYLIAGRRYDVTYFGGEDEPIVEVYEVETDL
jgi:hypothetical protein